MDLTLRNRISRNGFGFDEFLVFHHGPHGRILIGSVEEVEEDFDILVDGQVAEAGKQGYSVEDESQSNAGDPLFQGVDN